jgi:hypothetical protein
MIYNTSTCYSSKNIVTRDDAEDTRIKHLVNMRRLNPRISLSLSEQRVKKLLEKSLDDLHRRNIWPIQTISTGGTFGRYK